MMSMMLVGVDILRCYEKLLLAARLITMILREVLLGGVDVATAWKLSKSDNVGSTDGLHMSDHT